MIGNYSFETYDTNWIQTYVPEKSHWLVTYIYSMYFILMTMTTVGYGDIVPKNPIENSYVLIVMIVCSALFGYTLNSINQILDDQKKNKDNYSKKRYILQEYLKKRNISSELQMRIKNYFKHVWKNGWLDTMEQEEQVLSTLSGALKEELHYNDKGKILNRIPIFRRYFTSKFKRKLSMSMTEQHYYPGDIIFSNQEAGKNDSCLFYIYKGKVESLADRNRVIQKDDRKQIETIYERNYLGIDQLFTGNQLDLEIKSKDFTIVYCLERKNFLQILSQSEFHHDYETYFMVKDKLSLDPTSIDLHQRCYSCSENSHKTIHCPLLSYIANRKVLTRKFQKSFIQDRKENFRRNRRKNKSLSILKYIQSRLKDFEQEEFTEVSQSQQSQLSWGKLEFEEYTDNQEHQNQFQIKLEKVPSQKNLSNPKIVVQEECPSPVTLSEKKVSFQKLKNNKLKIDEEKQNNSFKTEKQTDYQGSPLGNQKNQEVVCKFMDPYLTETFDKYFESKNYFPNFNLKNVLRSYAKFILTKNTHYFKKRKSKRRKLVLKTKTR